MRVMRYVIALLTLSAAICHTVLAYDPTFDPPVDYPVGTAPRSICGADFDGDLDNDLAIANRNDSSVSVLINNGDGTFQSAVNYAVDGIPADIVAADFIGDSHIDLAVTVGVSNAISILVGNGDGTFLDTVYHVADTLGGPGPLCTGDFDDDGDNDLAVIGGSVTPFMRAYINDFYGYDFFEHLMVYEDTMPYDVVSADFNGDNLDDLAVLNYIPPLVYIYTATGGIFGWFTSYQCRFSNVGFDQIFCADVNNDSVVDIIGAFGGTNGGHGIFLGNGNGYFGEGSYTDSIGETNRLHVADLDDDGDPDIALTGISIDSVFVVVNDGSGSFSSPSAYYTGGMGTFIFAIELNGDNANDLVVSHYELNTVSVLINSGQVSGVNDSDCAMLPETLKLFCNYPNPFNPQTKIAYDLPGEATVTLNVFDASGRLVRELVDGEVLSAGRYETKWNGRNNAGRLVASGVYFYRLEAGPFSETKSMVLLK